MKRDLSLPSDPIHHEPILSWRIDPKSMYEVLGFKSYGKTHTAIIPKDFRFRGFVTVQVGGVGLPSKYTRTHTFYCRVLPPYKSHSRILVACPKCKFMLSFGRLHHHILSKTCLSNLEHNLFAKKG